MLTRHPESVLAGPEGIDGFRPLITQEPVIFAKLARSAAAIAATAVLLTGAEVAAPADAASITTAPRPDVGVEFHGLWAAYTDAQRIRILDTMRAAGVTTVRIDVSWIMLQPHSRYSYDAWGTSFVDHVIALCNARGIHPLMMLWMTPGWANNNTGEHRLPTNVADYARVARWAAARYTNKVAGWEVWNEENSTDFLPGGDPAAYTRLLRAAYPAFHAGYAPTTVVFGGLQYNDDAWLARAYTAGAHGYFDAVGVHPYMGVANLPPTTADNGTEWVLTHATIVHKLMVAHGDAAKPLWFTEFGWSSHPNPPGAAHYNLGVSEAVQAQDLTATVNLIRTTMPWVSRIYWYTEPRSSTGDPARILQRANYSVLRDDLSPKPVLYAIAAASR
jgi:polysaccharide biosynthesis protein PslG